MMYKMSTQIDNIVYAYKKLTKVPTLVSGRLGNNANKITAKWTIRNLDKGKNSKFMTTYMLNNNLTVAAESDFPEDISTELLSAISPREAYKALIREEKNGKESKKQFLEVWTRKGLSHSIDLTALDMHGEVYADSEFGSMEWMPDETSVMYVAEKKVQKTEAYIKRKTDDKIKKETVDPEPRRHFRYLERSLCDPEELSELALVYQYFPPKTVADSVDPKGVEYVYKQDWGEQLVGKQTPVIVLCQIGSEELTIMEGLPEGWCPGQVRFAPGSRNVVGVAWEAGPQRMGLVYCTNRPSYIFSLTPKGVFTKLSEPGNAVRSPRFSRQGDLVWLQRPAGGPHHSCLQLAFMKNYLAEGAKCKIIIDIVQTEIGIMNGLKFHGIYCQSLPERCFSNDGRRVMFSTPQQNEIRSYVADVDLRTITDISKLDCPGSTTVLDVESDVVLVGWSSFKRPSQLYVARLPDYGKESAVSWRRVSDPIDVPITVETSIVEYLHLEQPDTNDSFRTFNAIYLCPKADESRKLPMILWPHGGPHSNFVNAYSFEAAFFTALGFASVQVNYRGSTGMGQASVDFLPKKVGEADVKDCKVAAEAALKYFAVDPKRICLFGGSHGGFLVAHLSGQFPDMFAVVVTRNPVTDVATMYNCTDIADWCAVEAGFPFVESGPISEEQLLAMRRCSPVAHVHKVRAPTALMLGSGDRRVPCFQGLEYGRRLKANGVNTRIYMYDDNHSLSSTAAEMDCLINSVDWFFLNIGKL